MSASCIIIKLMLEGKAGTNQQTTMSYNFEQTLGDYKRREKQAMEKLENVTKAVKGGKGNMQASVAATEEIRTWVRLRSC